MKLHTQFFEWITLSLINRLKDEVGASCPPINIVGVPKGKMDDYEEWYDFQVLDIEKAVTRNNYAEGEFFFQISAFTKFSQLRQDKSFTRVYSMAGEINDIFENQNINIRKWGQLKELPDIAGCVRVFEGIQKFMNQRSLGGVKRASISSPYINAHSVIITYKAKMEVR